MVLESEVLKKRGLSPIFSLPTKVTYLLCMAECATRWKLLRYPREVGYFDKVSIVKVLDYYKKLAVSDGSES